MCHVLIIKDECVVALHLEGLLSDHGATSFAFAETEDLEHGFFVDTEDDPGKQPDQCTPAMGRRPWRR